MAKTISIIMYKKCIIKMKPKCILQNEHLKTYNCERLRTKIYCQLDECKKVDI